MGYQSKVTVKGQTTIPLEIREHLKLKPGDRIEHRIQDDGVLVKARNKRAIELAGMLHRPGSELLS
ncbi:AbrB/MazE/SpoVT family DNA-binding domain-containing protein [Mesorhizobium xinjiangense]|uniref:AbrB/MazE/SpoVT family DNA-binding domain-containing protein n=1 Tax=Mesorhizobium xinjiangense TaxID=2678685 RepID=UPI002E2591F0